MFMPPESSSLRCAFSNPEFVAQYAEKPPRLVPGFADLHRMTTLLLAEFAPRNARILVLGAGGGLELKAFAETHPDWTFDGVDPASEMLKLALRTLGPLASRVRLHEDYIDDAPEGPFDGATCLLTLHFLDSEERQRTLAEVRRRLKPGAPFVVVHASLPPGENERTRWLARYAAFGKNSEIDSEQAETARKAVQRGVSILAPEQDEELLRGAGFSNVGLFYAGLILRGWVADA
jgi:tRNA (cmo5U34)-methyltransferase